MATAQLPQDIEEKFNTVMPETTDNALCLRIDKPISVEGYQENFLPRIWKMVEDHGEIRLMTYYHDYQGWEEEAAMFDMAATLQYGKYLKKLALVDAPDKLVTQYMVKKSLISGEVEFFESHQLQDAIAWTKS